MKKDVSSIHLTGIVISIVALFILGSCRTTKNPINGIKMSSDLEETNLHGNVKSLTKAKFSISKNSNTGEIINRGLSKADPMNISYTFNEDGNITEKIDFDSDGNIHRRWTYDYLPAKKEIIERVYNAANEEIFKRIDQYDGKGNKIEHLGYSQADDDDDEPYKETFEYDKNGNIVKEIAYKANGQMQVVYTYNDEENLIEKKQLQNDNLIFKKTFEYDANGNLTKSERVGNRTVHRLYKNDKIVEQNSYVNGDPGRHYVYKYDDKGNRIGYKGTARDGSLEYEGQTQYEYDEKNNWTKKIPINGNGIPKFLIERKISY